MRLVAEGEALLNTVLVGVMDGCGAPKAAAAFRVLALQKVALSSAGPQHFSAGGNLEALGSRFLGFDAFWTSHKIENRFLKKDAQYRCPDGDKQEVFINAGPKRQKHVRQ